ncbi:monovalent cation/H+ antiporter subunit A [Methyloceanibacter caenitepidi]|uniref:Na(+) H(+) antiporter subunit A n=1 Tax=Methyloceanibacter caenitepidi TaxID=1384459 RepID=A0A0A8K770_9HYPH|nr:monovalent cation/H+ antiporter subunit A [Methyloceanibacter caenitepidi]BAQ17829.1 Na(+) H(+) antiporter subunit A [Methyloceanibacter caenitepidi]
MLLALATLTPFLGAVVPLLADRFGRDICAIATGAVTLTALVLAMSHAPAVYNGEVVTWSVPWLPTIGLSFSFFADGLGLFFAGLILGIGLLIILYARYYLGSKDSLSLLYFYLLLFQGAMVGIVLSDNILLLIVFWELTSLTSFLLIGYWRHLPESRQGARMALIVTGTGGLALIAGMVILGHIAGSYEITEILQRGDAVRSSPLFLPAMLLVLLGAFTKSAQFPFHFWLPHAMAAPTPVSAYLHSATMVKAGLFLMARLWPVFSPADAWFLIVAPIGLVTMLIAAWIALFRNDLKALLAYSTVSHLGLVTMLLGFGTPLAAIAAMFHILNHATFKAGLFMCAGIVDHEAGTRDIRRLGGLMTLMPITATLAMIGAASMAGIPLFNGFLSKEMMLEEASHTAYGGHTWVIPSLVTLAALFSAAYSYRFAISTFLGPVRDDYPKKPHDPPVGMWLPVALLAVLVIAIGIFPAETAGAIVERTASAVVGGPLPKYYLALWHGFTPALLMSVIALVGGAFLFRSYNAADQLRLVFAGMDAKSMFDAGVSGLVRGARGFINATHNGSFSRYAGVILVTILAVGAAGFFNAPHGPGTRAVIPGSFPATAAWLVLATLCISLLFWHQNRLLSLLLTSGVGLIAALFFLEFSAPDLSLTQISVDIVTTILLLLALNLVPQTSPQETSTGGRFARALVAAAVGLGIAALAYAIMTRDFQTISDYYLAEAKPGGGGTNVVNVILVDFRGFDTYGEIIVLGIAAITIFALLDNALRGAAARTLASIRSDREQSVNAHPMMLVVATRVLFPLVLVVAAFVFLRGHNEPGGGFIAGLIVAIALIMQYIASGYGWAASRMRLDSQVLIGTGVLIAGLTGVVSLIFGWPFLTSTYTYVHLPIVGEFELASAMSFDLGVFLAVVGVVMLSLAQISRVEARAEPEVIPEGPMDVPLKDGRVVSSNKKES